MTSMQDLEAYKSGFKEGKNSNYPTFKMFENMEDKINKISDDIGKIKIDIAKIPELIFDRADEKYASKKVEKVMWAMFGAVGLAVLTAILRLIIKQ